MNLPALRFKDFEDDWNLFSVNDLVNAGILHKPLDGNHGEIHPKSSDYVDEGIPFVMANDIKNNSIDLVGSKKITKAQADKLQKGFAIESDVLLTHKGSVGFVAIVPKIKTDYVMLTPQVTYYRVANKEKLINKFLATYFVTPQFQKQLLVLADGGTRAYIGITEQRNLELKIPKLSEQTKIANFLAAVDEKITQLTQKYELLAQYKKGVMQQIFSQELSFKDDDGQDFPEWADVRLASICEIKKGKQLNKEDLTDYDPHPVINGGQDPSGFTHLWNTEDNSITISEGGNSCGYINFIKQKFWSSGHCYTLCNIKDAYSKHYLYQALKFNEPQIMKLRVGSGLPNIQKPAISDFVLSIPKSKNEQVKIANFLTGIDDKLAYTQNQLEATKQYKQGLLQQMFV